MTGAADGSVGPVAAATQRTVLIATDDDEVLRRGRRRARRRHHTTWCGSAPAREVLRGGARAGARPGDARPADRQHGRRGDRARTCATRRASGALARQTDPDAAGPRRRRVPGAPLRSRRLAGQAARRTARPTCRRAGPRRRHLHRAAWPAERRPAAATPGPGSAFSGSVDVPVRCAETGGGAAWQRASFGTRRPGVQISPTRPPGLRPAHGSAAADHAARARRLKLPGGGFDTRDHRLGPPRSSTPSTPVAPRPPRRGRRAATLLATLAAVLTLSGVLTSCETTAADRSEVIAHINYSRRRPACGRWPRTWS